MDITVFENSIKNYFRTKYGVIYTSGINLTQIPDDDMFIYTCKLSFNNSDKPLAITGQYPDLDSFLLNVYKEIDNRRFYTTEYFSLRNVERLSNTREAILEKQTPSRVSTIDTVGDVYLKVLEKINPQLTILNSSIDLLSSTLDILSTTVYDQVFNVFKDAEFILNNNFILEEGSIGNITLTGNILQNDDTEIVSSIIDYETGEIILPKTFGSISVLDTGILSSRTYTGRIVVKRRNTTKTLVSNVVMVNFVFPFLYGTSVNQLLDTEMYTFLIKDISSLSDKKYTLNGNLTYLYFLIPTSYPAPKSITQNGINVMYAFLSSTVNVTSSGLTNNWIQNYRIFRTIDKVSVSNQEFMLNF